MLSKSDLFIWSHRLGAPRLFAGSPDHRLTTLLYHRFVFDGESVEAARERLRRQCAWLAETYTPVSADDARAFLDGEKSPARPLLVTTDDASVDLLEVIDVFNEFDMPIVVFTCVGWTDHASDFDEETALARAVSDLYWYPGAPTSIEIDGDDVAVASGGAADAIDRLIEAAQGGGRVDLEAIVNAIETQPENGARATCDWAEVHSLAERGATIGSHSISHAKLAQQSSLRKRFEILESRRILSRKTYACADFAYPFGTSDAFDEETGRLMTEAGYSAAFVTTPRLAPPDTDRHEVPRLVLPDTAMPLAEFKARAHGVNAAVDRLKGLMS